MYSGQEWIRMVFVQVPELRQAHLRRAQVSRQGTVPAKIRAQLRQAQVLRQRSQVQVQVRAFPVFWFQEQEAGICRVRLYYLISFQTIPASDDLLLLSTAPILK